VLELKPFHGRRGGRLRSPQADRLVLRSNPVRGGRWSLAGAAGRISLVRDRGWHPLGPAIAADLVDHYPRADGSQTAALHVAVPDEMMLVSELRIALTFACWLIALWESTPSPAGGGGGG
jgi:hypothetical protein